MSNKFKIPPVSTLLGSTIGNYIKILSNQKISSKYIGKIFLTTLIVLISTPFHWWEELIFNKKKIKNTVLKKPPLFIIGHWRSGTTLLHNLLCQDPKTSYVTTYQTIFPNNLASKLIFQTFMKLAMPERRPADNMKLGVSLPQEDEFALSNMYHNSYYNFFYFPNNYKEFYDKSINFKNLEVKEEKEWCYYYDKLLKKAYLDNDSKEQLILKNPVNTARIKLLLDLYPNAKFIYIYRNPITVFLSTQKFFRVILKTLMLQAVDNEFIDNMIFDVYERLMEDYLKYRSLIPKGNLYEIRYEDFEADPIKGLKIIYSDLLHADFYKVEPKFVEYLKSVKEHKKQQYEVEKPSLDLITKRLDKYIKLYNYQIPEEIIVK